MRGEGTTTSVKFPNEILAAAFLRADELSTSRSQIIIRGTEWITGCDAAVLNRMAVVRGMMQLTEAEFVLNAVLEMLARNDALEEVYGSREPRTDMDFVKGDSVKTYQQLKSQYVRGFERELLEIIIAAEKEGHKLNAVQKAIAIKYRFGKSWHESDERKLEAERQRELEKLGVNYSLHMAPELVQDERVTRGKAVKWDDLPLLLGVKETAAVIGYGQARIRELCRKGTLPNIQHGRAYRIPREALREWVLKRGVNGESGS